MVFQLWDSIPSDQQRQHPRYGWGGCPYAVKNTWTIDQSNEGYRRCSGFVPEGWTACSSHEPKSAARRDGLMGRVISVVPWEIRRQRREGLAFGSDLQVFRGFSDDDIDAIRMVGVKIATKIREIRDTWDDTQVIDLLGFTASVAASLEMTDAWREHAKMVAGG